MKKIEGLKFLNTFFNDCSIDSSFIEDQESFTDFYHEHVNDNCLFRVRGCNRYGSELNLPMASFDDIKLVLNYMIDEKSKNKYMDFVVHCVDNEYFNPVYIGTLAVYNDVNKPSVQIEIQKVTKELVSNMDKVRPRDWPVAVALDYDFLSKIPIITKFDDIDLNEIKEAIYKLFKIGMCIYNIYDSSNVNIDTYTRFNIYTNNSIILDDHRSVDSFILQKKR